MILEKQTEATVHQDGESKDSIGMSLDLDSAQVLMQMLSKNLYSDSIGSTVRECASNALDSHRRAGQTKPIIVSFKAGDSNNLEFSVEDFGIGLDADDVKNIISKYGKSTKRNSNTELGMMGLGFKAPLAYSSSFYFVCRKDGMERKYMMYEGEDTNTIDLLYEKATTEANGVKVIVPIQYYDRNEFKTKIREQLAYFENVYFDCGDLVDNNFSIFRNELFQFSELASESVLHLCLDNVYYPIDFQKLGIDIIRFPVALRFSLTDGLFPTPNRESIRYTKEGKDIILKKITELANFFVNKYNESVQDTDDIENLMDFYSNEHRYVSILKAKYDAGLLKTFATVKFNEPKLKGINILDMKKIHRNREYILNEYDVKYRIQNGKWRECKNYWDVSVHRFSRNSYNEAKKTYIYSERISGHKKDYLKSISPTGWSDTTIIVKKGKDFKLGSVRAGTDYSTYMDILNLRLIPKDQWRDAIKEFHSIVEMYRKNWEDLDALVVPQAFIDSKKKVRIKVGAVPGQRRQKLKGEIIGKQASPLERDVHGQNSKFVSTTYQLENAHKFPFLHVYGGQSDKDRLDHLYGAFKKCTKDIKFIMFSERELANLEKIELHNWIKLDKFMEGINKPFRRIVTAHLIGKLIETYKPVFRKIDNMEGISKDLHNKLKTLNDYENKYNPGYMSGDTETIIFTTLLEISEKNNLFDGEIYPIYQEIKTILDKFPFIKSVFDVMKTWGSDQPLQQVVVDLLKYNKHKVNLNHYAVKLTEDSPLEQELTEETVVELQD
jgi:hypothetical protein